MFGYIVVNQQEMKFKEFDEYHRYYCGLCKALKDGQGLAGEMSLSYDMTFLVMLLTGLYEPDETRGIRHCAAHPFVKHEYIRNEYSGYAADMNRILTYYKCQDDWQDEKKVFRKLYGDRLISKKDRKAFDELTQLCDKRGAEDEAQDEPDLPGLVRYRHKFQVITDRLEKISALEQEGSDDLDLLSGYFGEVLAEIFAYRPDEWEDGLRKIGYYLGKFVYILDAYDDIEKDRRKKNFNPLFSKLNDFTEEERRKTGETSGNPAKAVQTDESPSYAVWQRFSDWTREILMLQAAECAKEFEKLPIIKNVEILRNIMYSGIWSKFYKKASERCGGNDKK